jgi:hypothetical protein
MDLKVLPATNSSAPVRFLDRVSSVAFGKTVTGVSPVESVSTHDYNPEKAVGTTDRPNHTNRQGLGSGLPHQARRAGR